MLDHRLIGKPTLMVTLVKLNHHGAPALHAFPEYMHALPEVTVCMRIIGEFDFLLQVCLADPQAYETFLENKLCVLPMVEKVQSSVVLREYKNHSAIVF